MAKYAKLNEPVFITNVEIINSIHGGEVWEVKLKGVKSQKDYKTYIDPLNNNFHHWEWIIEAAHRKGVVLSNAKIKDPVKGIINADSSIQAEYVVTKEELADVLADYWNSKDKFNDLFGKDI